MKTVFDIEIFLIDPKVESGESARLQGFSLKFEQLKTLQQRIEKTLKKNKLTQNGDAKLVDYYIAIPVLKDGRQHYIDFCLSCRESLSKVLLEYTLGKDFKFLQPKERVKL